MKKQNNTLALPLITLYDGILFPGTILHVPVYDPRNAYTAAKAINDESNVFCVLAIDPTPGTVISKDTLAPVGVVAKVRQFLRGDRTTPPEVILEGMFRMVLDGVERTDDGLLCRLDEFVPEPYKADSRYDSALRRKVTTLLKEYITKADSSEITEPEGMENAAKLSIGDFADTVASCMLSLSAARQQTVLETANERERLESVLSALKGELDYFELEGDIDSKVHSAMDDNQREFYLREQLRIINEELGEVSGDDVSVYSEKLAKLSLPEKIKSKLAEEIQRLGRMQEVSPDASIIRTYLDKCLALPWNIFTEDDFNLEKARAVLDRDHYGMKEVKDRIIEYLAAISRAPKLKGQIICLAGPPGVGKTSIGKSIAEATGRKYERLSLGGVDDEAELRGHRRTYIGAMPGRIINAMINAGSMNPLILLDEVDKLGSGGFRGDPAAALLEILDGEQNFEFTDHYIDFPFDLSNVLFVTTANDKFAIPDALRDRMEIIELPSYTHTEKFNIAKKHLIPKQRKAHNIKASELRITDAAVNAIIEHYTREAGVRVLERNIAKICRKADIRFLKGETKVSVTPKNLSDYLGAAKIREDDDDNSDAVGAVNGLAWTSVGGVIMNCEVIAFPGTGKVKVTGSLGGVMKESVGIALSLVRSRAAEYGIRSDYYKKHDIHVHFPEGAVPKDGPSAGITITTALFSAFSDTPVRGDVAMTGEITLRGNVLPIGGLREKTMAAYRRRINTVIIPEKNLPDLEEIDEEVKNNIRFVPVRTIDEVLKTAFVKMPEPIEDPEDPTADPTDDESSYSDQNEPLSLSCNIQND